MCLWNYCVNVWAVSSSFQLKRRIKSVLGAQETWSSQVSFQAVIWGFIIAVNGRKAQQTWQVRMETQKLLLVYVSSGAKQRAAVGDFFHVQQICQTNTSRVRQFFLCATIQPSDHSLRWPSVFLLGVVCHLTWSYVSLSYLETRNKWKLRLTKMVTRASSWDTLGTPWSHLGYLQRIV